MTRATPRFTSQAAQGTADMVKLLAPLSPLSLRNKYGHTALYIAAVKGPKPSHVEHLLPHVRREVLLARYRNESFGKDWVASEEERDGGVSVLLATTRCPRQVWTGETADDTARTVGLLIDAMGSYIDPREAKEVLGTLRRYDHTDLAEKLLRCLGSPAGLVLSSPDGRINAPLREATALEDERL